MLETLVAQLHLHPIVAQILLVLTAFAAAAVVYWIAQWVLVRAMSVLARRTEADWDDVLLEQRVFHRLALIAPALVMHNLLPVLPVDGPAARRFLGAYALWASVFAMGALLNAIHALYQRHPLGKLRPIKGYLQIAKLLLYLAGAILIIATLLDTSPWIFLSGLGAATAILALVFRDTILSFVASLQIASNDLVRVGDWIEAPKFGADGDVIDIALHTVKVQNGDKTITVIPTYKLIDESFKNWRGMTEAGARRIKRAVSIDTTSVAFARPEQLERWSRMSLLSDYLPAKQLELEAWNRAQSFDPSVLANGRRITNLGTFRAYLERYVRAHPRVRLDLPLAVRQLAAGPDGLPLEIYCYCTDTRWAVYEGIQADIFDHVFSVLREFDLRVFQRPTGHDLTPGAQSNSRPAAAASE